MRGFTLIEILIVVAVAGMVLAITVPRAQASLDRSRVQAAAADVRSTVGYARSLAIAGQSAVALEVDSSAGLLILRRGTEVLLTRGIGTPHGVALRRTRDSIAFDAFGLGRGAANLSILLRRGVATETVFVSRLGRVR